MPGARERAHGFGDGPDYPQDTRARADAGQVPLLDRAQRLGRRGVAGKDHQRAAALEEPLDGLERVGVDHLERPVPVGRARVVPQVEEIVPREDALDLPEHGQAAEPGVEYSDGVMLHASASIQGVPGCGERSLRVSMNSLMMRAVSPQISCAPKE